MCAWARIKDLDLAHIIQRGLPYDIAWDYADVFGAVGLRLLEWRGGLFMHAGETLFLESVGRLLRHSERGC
jgi:hypothetical protein